MFQNTSRNRNTRRLMIAAAFVSLTASCAANLMAQATVAYLQQITAKGQVGTFPQIPSTSTLNPGICPANSSQPLCSYGPFRLPGYGNSVYISFSGDVPALSWAHSKPAEIRTTSNSAYKWGADTDFLSISQMNPRASGNYTINFYFDGINPPNPSDLALVVYAFKDGSTAGVRGINASGATAKLSLSNSGEYLPPSDPTWWCWPTCISAAPTVFPGTTGVPTFSSGYANNSKYDSRNTGWDIYQPNSPGLRVLSLDVSQVLGDGLGFTLGYRTCTCLVASSLDSRDGRVRHLYDLNPATGAATNSRQIGAEWGLAFSPISPTGTLYALARNAGTPAPNTLFSVNVASGAATQVPTSPALNPLDRGGLAADPTTGILYGVDGAGYLFSINAGVITQIGKIAGSGFQVLAAVAFDPSGNLFVVDAASNRLLRVAAPINAANAAAATSVPMSPHKVIGYGALAIDPWTGNAYYTEAGLLYSLNLTNGGLSVIAPITGAEDFGYLANMTFTEGYCPAASAPVVPVPSAQ